MCEHCSPYQTVSFPTDEHFKAFEKVLDAKCLDGTFVRLLTSEDRQSAFQEPMYQCSFCGDDWVLSVPHHIWRGYFLTEDQLLHSKKNTTTFNMSSRSSKGCGCCLVLFLLFVGLIFYGMYSLFSFLFGLFF